MHSCPRMVECFNGLTSPLDFNGIEVPAYKGNMYKCVTSVLRPSEFEWTLCNHACTFTRHWGFYTRLIMTPYNYSANFVLVTCVVCKLYNPYASVCILNANVNQSKLLQQTASLFLPWTAPKCSTHWLVLPRTAPHIYSDCHVIYVALASSDAYRYASSSPSWMLCRIRVSMCSQTGG